MKLGLNEEEEVEEDEEDTTLSAICLPTRLVFNTTSQDMRYKLSLISCWGGGGGWLGARLGDWVDWLVGWLVGW